jgi:thiamine transporter
MIPVFYIAARHGGMAGCLTGLLMGLGQLFFGPYIVHPAQLVLDYPLAFALIGVGGFIPARNLFLTEAGIVLGSLLRYASHVVSGVIFFSEYAPEGSNVWVYSLGYNASYLVPQVILALIIVYPIIRLMSRFDGREPAPGREGAK